MGGELHCWPHLVNWLILFLSKKDGGLGIRNLTTLNKALFGKWCWRFASKNASFIIVERWPSPFAKSLMDDLNVKSLPPLSPTTRVVSLLNQVIVRKYEKEEGGWCSGSLREGYGVGLWKAIGKGWKDFSKRVVFRKGMEG